MNVAGRSVASLAAALSVGLFAGCDRGEGDGAGVRAEATNARRASTAPARLPGFSVGQTSVRLPEKCRPHPVSRLAVRLLAAFNRGEGARFADAFATPRFHPYSFRISGAGFNDRESIQRFVAERHRAGDGWSATHLAPPTGEVGLPREAVYALTFRISQRGAFVRMASAKLVVDCRSGLLSAWVGPAYGPKDVRARQT
jgi:hypothetical protein